MSGPGAVNDELRAAEMMASLINIIDDDDDMESYEPSTERSDSDLNDEYEDTEDDEDDFMDAQDTLSGVEIEFEVGGQGEGADDDQDEDEDGDGNRTETERNTAAEEPQPQNVRTINLSQADIMRIITQHAPLRRLLHNPGIFRRLGTDDDDEDYGYGGFRRRRRERPKDMANRFPKVPSEQGRVLMESGIYGSRDHFSDVRRKRKSTISERLMYRRLGLDSRGTTRRENRLIAQKMIPTGSAADMIIHYEERAYSGQFSDDGSFFFSASQDYKVRMYDTSNPYDWKYYKAVDYPFGQWTITDASLSPDNRLLAYSSIRHVVCLATTDPLDQSDPAQLDFRKHNHRSSRYGQGFGIWSIRFSGDGREIVAGTGHPSVVVYDLETSQTVLKLDDRHTEDVNAVCFADTSSPHILYSGSDDQTLRVWDRRSMADGREAGVFVGHTEGLTYIDSKGDGRYVLSNGKDQMMKLWDLRKMTAPSDFDQMNISKYTNHFDYRMGAYDFDEYFPNPEDCSVVTFRGHAVLKTLIRCHFSPPGSSDERYVYSGSEDGKVWIWNLDGTVAGQVDVVGATKGSSDRHTDLLGYGGRRGGRYGNDWSTCVRDASWHPTAPVLAATSWNGYGLSSGTVTLHSWNDDADDDEADPPMSTNYGARLNLRDDLNRNTRHRGNRGSLRSRVVRPARLEDDAEDAAAW